MVRTALNKRPEKNEIVVELQRQLVGQGTIRLKQIAQKFGLKRKIRCKNIQTLRDIF